MSRQAVHAHRICAAPGQRAARTLQSWLVLVSILLLALFPTSCNRQLEVVPPNPNTIKIGYFGDLSGPTLNFGRSALNGLLMAADEINRAGGVGGKKLDVVIEDDQGSPERAAMLVTKLIREDKVVAVIAGGASGSSLAAAPRAQAAKIPFVSSSSTDPAVTRTGDYIFRVCYTDTFQGEVMGRFSTDKMKAATSAIMVDFNNPYSRGLSDFFELSFTKRGGRVLTKQSYAQGDPDFRGQLSAIKAAGPDVIYVPGYYGDVGLIAKQARQLGLTQPLLGGDGWDAPELWSLGGDALNGSFISNHYSADDPAAEIQTFVSNYKLLYGNLIPDAHAALGYDAMRFLIEGVQRAESMDGTRIRDALAQTKNFQGVTGVINLDAERNAVKPAVILKLENTVYIYQETMRPEK
ncbi:MAG TPA: ABC transporter substrate-binding protein [Pyrinomonadaceae bacterium]